ncbi:hypothetical protein ACA910_004136 [Epithemia clementina (nom. ined.)]
MVLKKRTVDDDSNEVDASEEGRSGESSEASESSDSGDEEAAPNEIVEQAEDDDEDDDDDDDDNNDDDDDDDDDDDKNNENYKNKDQVDATNPEVDIKQPVSANGEPCTFDLRNLLAINAHQIDVKAMYKGKQQEEGKVSISLPQNLEFAVVDEAYLLKKAMDGCAQLVDALWQLPKENSDVGAMVRLPLHDDSRVPRALPPPEPKKETKWEKFAKERGIPSQKNKRSRKVWDEATGSWMYRHGYQKANDDTKEWPIMEVKDNEDPFQDPWEKQREAKRSKLEKNTEQRMRNQERAGVLAKGTTTRFLKSANRSRKSGKAGGNMDRDDVVSVKVPPSGVPVDLKPTKKSGPIASVKRGKESTVSALLATQRSTASMGRFDKMREDEPERKKAIAGLKKRKYENPTDKQAVQRERERSLKVFKNVVEGGGVAKERNIKKGKYAKGETALDYEYDDGLGPSSFRKKKGRAGIGKARKLTKKRIK